MTWQLNIQPFEDVSPIKSGDFALSFHVMSVFRGVCMPPREKQVTGRMAFLEVILIEEPNGDGASSQPVDRQDPDL